MDIRGPGRASNAHCCLDLLRRHLPLFLGLRIGLDSRSHPRIAGCRGDDLFMAVGSGSGPICDLPSFRRSSRVIDQHRRIRRHHRNRNDLVVACSEQQVLKWTIEAVTPSINSMRVQIEHHADLEAAPRSLFRGECRIDITEIVDQWYGPGFATSKSERMTIACTAARVLVRDAAESSTVSHAVASLVRVASSHHLEPSGKAACSVAPSCGTEMEFRRHEWLGTTMGLP
jgi:hypothetical protein